MNIRSYNKTRLNADMRINLEKDIHNNINNINLSLKFWTTHPAYPSLIDLNVFKSGTINVKSNAPNKYFSGRPELISQLFPIIKADIEPLSISSIKRIIAGLRSWWRLFDEIEDKTMNDPTTFRKVNTLEDITDIHRQWAYDSKMNIATFNNVVRIFNLARTYYKLPRLHWKFPSRSKKTKHLLPRAQINDIRFSLKHEWRAVLLRWENTDSMINMEEKKIITDTLLTSIDNLHKPYLFASEIVHALSENPCSNLPYRQKKIHKRDIITERLFYPNIYDIQLAFHLCLANTGWNPSTLLGLDLDTNFLEDHPKDPTRYLLRGFKERGKSEHISEGLYKSRESAGVILHTIIKRTSTIRNHLYENLKILELQYEELKRKNVSEKKIEAKRKEITTIRFKSKSPWIFTNFNGIQCLNFENYSFCQNGTTFIRNFIDKININRAADKKISYLKPSDFRDAFAEYAYRSSGGMILYVMNALGHRSPTTTQRYLDNTILNEESKNLYSMFSNTLWNEIEFYNRADPTILAKICRDGNATNEERERLNSYRSLRRSRIGVGCKDPFNPPRSIDSNFKPNGKAMCHVHRCTLCIENAVIFPESISGLCKRLAELRHIRNVMSEAAFSESSFFTEMRNTEFALKHFDDKDVSTKTLDWEDQISQGKHRVIDFEGDGSA